MRGFPKNLNTKFDYEFVLANFTNTAEGKAKVKQEFQKLLDKEYEKIKSGNIIGDEQATADKAAEEKFVPGKPVIKVVRSTISGISSRICSILEISSFLQVFRPIRRRIRSLACCTGISR